MLVDTLAFNLLKETKFRKMISGKERDVGLCQLKLISTYSLPHDCCTPTWPRLTKQHSLLQANMT